MQIQLKQLKETIFYSHLKEPLFVPFTLNVELHFFFDY